MKPRTRFWLVLLAASAALAVVCVYLPVALARGAVPPFPSAVAILVAAVLFLGYWLAFGAFAWPAALVPLVLAGVALGVCALIGSCGETSQVVVNALLGLGGARGLSLLPFVVVLAALLVATGLSRRNAAETTGARHAT